MRFLFFTEAVNVLTGGKISLTKVIKLSYVQKNGTAEKKYLEVTVL